MGQFDLLVNGRRRIDFGRFVLWKVDRRAASQVYQRAVLEDACSSAHPDHFGMAFDKGSTEKDLGTRIPDNHEVLFASIFINLILKVDDSQSRKGASTLWRD